MIHKKALLEKITALETLANDNNEKINQLLLSAQVERQGIISIMEFLNEKLGQPQNPQGNQEEAREEA